MIDFFLYYYVSAIAGLLVGWELNSKGRTERDWLVIGIAISLFVIRQFEQLKG